MAIINRKVSEFPEATNPRDVNIFGQDGTTGDSVKVNTEYLVGDTGPAPEITISMTAVPYGTAPSVDKSGTDTAPNFNIRFPLAADGKTPMLQVAGGYIQYRYSDTETWQNLVAMSILKGVDGEDGKSAYEIAVDNGFVGTEEEWLSSLHGADGDDGKTPVFAGSTATSLDPSSPPAVSLSQTGTDDNGNPVYALALGIPQGQQGDPGLPLVLVNGTMVTGAPGSDVLFTLTYSGDDPNGAPIYRVDGSIPQGAPGAGNGNVEIDASTLESGKQYVFTPNENGSPIGTFQEVVVPDTQVQANWNETDITSKAYIQGKPTLATVATSGAYNDLTGRPTLTPSFVTGNTFAATATGVAQTQQVRSIQNGVGTPVVTQLPVATESAAGVMPASAFAQIQQNTATIQSIIQGGGKEWPSMATYADLVAFGMPSSATQNDVIKVRDDETQDGATTQYVATDNGSGLEWVFNLIVNFDPVGLATTTTPGLKKSSTVDGQTFTESDGTDSVVGWDSLKQRMTNVETGLLLKADADSIVPAVPDGTNPLFMSDGKINPIYLPGSTIPVEDAYVEVAGVKWATRNIGLPGQFAETISDPGMLYKFNNKVGWPPTGTISAINPASNGVTEWDINSYKSGIGWLKENDPTPEGWRLPTGGSGSEFSKLASAFSVWDSVNFGRWFADIESDLGNPEKSLFLPAVGYRYYSSGSIQSYSPESGYYWSRTPLTSTAENIQIMRFDSTEIYPSYGNNNANAIALRCVKIV